METSAAVFVWWAALSLASVFNLGFWFATARRVSATDRAQRVQMWLSLVFTAACAFRAILPRAEASRICLYDVSISSATITRSVATIAELCFAAQFALVLAALARDRGWRSGVVISGLTVPSIAVAEVASWYSALTANYLGSVIEEAIWASNAGVYMLALAILARRSTGAARSVLLGGAICAGGYFFFMCTVDVPMYWSRWIADEARQKVYLSLGAGWLDASRRSVVTWRFEDWVQEMPWMTLYFTIGVWVSIGIVRYRKLLQSRHTTIADSNAS